MKTILKINPILFIYTLRIIQEVKILKKIFAPVICLLFMFTVIPCNAHKALDQSVVQPTVRPKPDSTIQLPVCEFQKLL